MPTGYTSSIKDGISFKQFAMNCARAFGVCAEMKDESMDKPIPEQFKASEYHVEKLAQTHKQKAELLKMVDTQLAKEAKEAYDKEVKEYKHMIEECGKLKLKYEAMLEQVKAYKTPSDDFVEFKRFMIEQIEGSIEHDCSVGYYTKELNKLKQLSGEEWFERQLEMYGHDIEYHTKRQLEELKRIENRNKWIKDLRDSLK